MNVCLKKPGFFWLMIFLGIASFSLAADFENGSADFTHPYLSAWHPGFYSKLYGIDPYTSLTGWREYSVEGTVLVSGIECVPVHYTSSLGSDYYFYLAQDTNGNIRYLRQGDTSFLPNPPNFLPAETEDGASWDIQYLTGQHRFNIYDHDTYEENGSGYGPYSNSLFMRHYWDGALMGQIITALRWGYVQYDGQDIVVLSPAALSTVQGYVYDAWNLEPIEGATVWLGHYPPRKTTTDSQGFYRFIDLPQQYYQIEVQKQLFLDFTQTVNPPLGGTMNQDIPMIPESGVLTGRIEDALTGLPVFNSTIQLDGDENLRVNSDAQGIYRFEEVRVGDHYVHAWGPVYLCQGTPVEVIKDEETVQDFQLYPVYGSIHGTLRDSLTMAPIEGGTVQLDDLPETQIVTGADGAFVLEDVQPGEHYFQAWKNGYLFYQKRIEIAIEQSLDLGDVLLAPESTLLPEGTDFSFDEGPEGWRFFNIPGQFDVPLSSDDNGHLGLCPNGAVNCYGYWESPYIAFTPGTVYRVLFTLKSNRESPVNVPMCRLRVNSGNNQKGAFLVIDSTDDGDSSPTTTPKLYQLIFTPPTSSSSKGLTISFDLVNIGTKDDPTIWIYLEQVDIEKVTINPEED